MIVCLCCVVSDTRIRELARDGARTVKAIERACGAGSDCGTCRAQVACVLKEVSESERDSQGGSDERPQSRRDASSVLVPLRTTRAA